MDFVTFENFLNEEKWIDDVKTKYSPPEDLFTKDASTVVNTLLKDSKDATQTLHRLMFYINRAGKNLTNKTELEKAKSQLQDKIK